MKVKRLLDRTKKKVEALDKEFAYYETDVYWILTELTGLSRTTLSFDREIEISSEDVVSFEKMFARRLEGEPIQYILGYWEFMGIKFLVNENVLIPRLDTEVLIDYVLGNIVKKDDEFIDMCTGSGCIGISVLALSEAKKATLVDISSAALELAKENAKINSVYDRLELIESDLFNKLEEKKVDFILSNPPYIKKSALETLSEEVKKEPVLALDGGESGLDFYERIVADSKNYLKNGGHLIFEIGHDQGEEVSELLKKNGFEDIEVIKDLANLDRIVKGTYNV